MNNNPVTEEEIENMSEEQLLDLFVEQMLADRGLDALEGEVRKEVHEDLKEKLTFEVNRAILAALPEEDFDKLNAKIEAGEATDETITEAIQGAGIDVDAVTEAAMMDFRRVFLEGDIEAKDSSEGQEA